MSEPLVLALVCDAVVGAELAAGFEEEGVPVTVAIARGAPLILAREAAKTAALGIGIGADGARLVLVLAASPAAPYLEADAGRARLFGSNAARIAAHRPLALG
ncbi:MAG TPA: glycerol dehydratase reactivase beta/small subunit family protein [Solirubrobacteraceae bacterium]|jgi:hypothetical protein|nr:glycerol dehydratase reactivase beta/small subunit family protein [Solirubrobacteraceae bacterium]